MFKLAYYNITRRKNKSLMAIIITIITIMILVVIWSVYGISQSGIALSCERMGADVLILPDDPRAGDIDFIFTGISRMVYMNKNVIDGKLPMEDIEAITPQFFLETLPEKGCCSTDLQVRIVGFDFQTDFILKPWFKMNNIKNFTGNDIIKGSKINSFVKQTLILNNLFRVAGVLYPTGTGMDDSVFISIEKARAMAKKSFSPAVFNNRNVENLVTSYLIKLKNGADAESFLKKCKDSRINARIVSVSKTRLDIKNKLSRFLSILLLFWISVVLTCFISLVAQFNGMIADRKREIGYLRAIGMKKKNVIQMVFLEVGILGGIGGFIGSVSGILCVSPLLVLLQNILAVPEGEWTFTSVALRILAGTLFSFVICFAGSIVPAIKSANMEPHEAISQGEL